MLDKETENLYVQNVEEFVLDENKVVTYKWLSSTLGVHVNTAKQLLYAFVTQSDEAQKAGIKKTFLITGILADDGGCKVTIVKEEDLQKVKSQYKSVTSEHIYSVQKVKNDTSLLGLYKVDHSQDDNNPLPAVSCSKSLLRTDSEVAKLRVKAEAATVTNDSKQWPTAPSKKSAAIKLSSKNIDDSVKEVTNGEADHTEKLAEANSVAIKNGAKTGSIAAMFAAQGSRGQKPAEVAKATTKPTTKGKSGGIATFFNKNVGPNTQTEKLVKDLKKEDILKKMENQDSDSGKLCRDDSRSPEKKRKLTSDSTDGESHINKKLKAEEDREIVKRSKKLKGNTNAKVNKNNKKGNETKHENSKEPSAKKRRRIIVADSDSDDDVFEKEELPESPPPFEEPEPVVPSQHSELEDVIPCTPQQQPKKGRKHIRKLVDKTYMDDEGYMNTKKEFVFVSCSDSETDEGKENGVKTNEDSSKSKDSVRKDTESEIKESPKKLVSPPQRSKQATLMNFFKKS